MTTADGRPETPEVSAEAAEVGGPDRAERPPSALTVPDFRRLWVNNALFFLVVNAQRFTFGWLVLDGLDGAEFEQGLVTFALGIPMALLILPAGAWADRLDRRRQLAVSQAATAVVMALTALLVSADRISINALLMLAVAFGAAQALGHPIRTSLIPALVAPEQLFNAIAINAIAMTFSMIAGPVLFQLLGDAYGFGGTFAAQALLLVVGMAALVRLRIPDAAGPDAATASPQDPTLEDSAPSMVAEVAEAVRHVAGHRAVATLFVLLVVSSLTVNPSVMVTLQAFVQQELGGDGGDVAPLLAMMGLGIAISSTVIMRKGNLANKGVLFQRAMMVGSLSVVAMGRVPSFAYLVPLTLFMGLAGGFYINMNQGLIQANTPGPLMGRVMALFTLVQLGIMPIGALILGTIGSVIGLAATLSLAGAIAFFTVLVVYLTDDDLRSL